MAKSELERIDDYRIMKLFRGRCVVCKQRATEINEITPRSRSKDAITMKANRVPMCRLHHQIYHQFGVTDEKMEILREYAITMLTSLGEPMENW